MMPVNRRKVLVLFSSAAIGGAERSIGNMAINNSNESVSYQLATFGSNGPLSNWIKSNDFECFCFNKNIIQLIRFISYNKPYVVYVIGFRLSVLLRFYCKIFTKIRIVQGVRWNPSSNSRLDRTFRVVEKFFSFLIDGYIVNSNSAKKLLLSIPIEKVELIYNGISDNNFNQKELTQKKYVVTVANLAARKGYLEYLEIIDNIIKEYPETQFLFLGYDNLNGKVQKLIKEKLLSSNVIYLGFKENIGEYLKKSIFFVLPSLYGEGCPTSILEAFKYKLPVIAYEIDGIPEIVENDFDGILVDQVNKNSLENAIKDLLNEPEKIKIMGQRGYEKLKKNYLLDTMIEKHNSFFLDLN
jgi:glycosyltransferase involved in cell wall biosynthesis